MELQAPNKSLAGPRVLVLLAQESGFWSPEGASPTLASFSSWIFVYERKLFLSQYFWHLICRFSTSGNSPVICGHQVPKILTMKEGKFCGFFFFSSCWLLPCRNLIAFAQISQCLFISFSLMTWLCTSPYIFHWTEKLSISAIEISISINIL